MNEAKYHLECLECRHVIADSYTNTCPEGHDSLLRTVYKSKRIRKRSGQGMFNYIDWLPVEATVPVNTNPITYKSEELGKELGLENLYVSFSGYWPEKGVFMKTCTFKELEALPTLLRAHERAGEKILVVASAGNTSRAFAEFSAMTGMPVVTIVPHRYTHRMWTTTEDHESIFLIAVDGDYSDASAASKEIVNKPLQGFRGQRGGAPLMAGLIEEGGVRNVARRDGMGVVELEAAWCMKALPDYYVQAVGSGTGAIAAWEAFIRLIGDGRFGERMPKIVIAQNLPFAPMFSAWQDGRAELIAAKDLSNAEAAIKAMYANILSTRNPPYSIKGGVYEMLRSSQGTIYGITNDEAREAEKLFESEEGIDLDPAASVAVASLMHAVDEGFVEKKDRILLNITGGGYKRLKEECALYHVEARMELHSHAVGQLPVDELERELKEFVTGLYVG
ncbi:MAG: cysteate synthase [Methanophagales archaeon ANME-1-THS]|nr:MAG: cysteate synthase [Methanophagales archaeon ANME-1-THS]